MVLAVTTITRSGKKNSTICPSNNANYCRDFFKDISAKLRFKKEKKVYTNSLHLQYLEHLTWVINF